MNRIKQLKEQRGAKLKELEALQRGAEKRAFTADEGTKFDAIEAEIRAIDADLAREERAAGLAAAQPVEGAKQLGNEALGLSAKEVRSYSLLGAISRLAANKPLEGLEAEASAAEARRLGRDPSGFFVPFEVFAGAREARATMHNVGTAADGGHLVGVDVDYSNLVGLLRNQSHVLALGARVITGLMNDVSIPRVLTGASAYWVSETGEITASKGTFGQIQMKPRRLGSTVPYSKQLLAQSGIGIEQFVRDDILGAFGVELDRVAINGSGAAEPLGILNLANADRATSITFGAAATFAKVVEFETNVETANALGLPGSDYAYLTTPAVKGKWKTAVKVSGAASFLWENGNIVNGYAARSTNQVPSGKVIFGQPGQIVYGEWAGTDITVDALTLAKTGQVQVTIQKFVDMVVRQGKAFAISTDSGAQ